jgi:drug/metabolite transporter (DMT)-like permease
MCLAATWVIWGSTYYAIKLALTGFPPFLQNGTRFLFAGSVLLAWARWRRQTMPTLVQWRNAAIVGTLMLAANVGGVAFAEQWLASGLVTAFIAIVPALITVASLLFGVRPSRLEVLGIVLGFVGVLLLVRGNTFTASPVGVLAMVTAALGWSTGSVLSQHMLRLAPAASGFSSAMLCAGGVLIVLSIVTGERLHWPPPSCAALAWLYLSIFGSLIAYSAYLTLLANTRPALATSNSFVNPVIAMVLGVAIGGEMVAPQEWLAVGIIVFGIAALILARR